MNKKLLFAAMSLVALTACTNDEFQSKQQIAEEASPIQFEVINNAFTRASMDGNKIVWNANDGDLFTLYHGAALGATNGYENATYTAKAGDGTVATLSTPSMIKAGGAIMVWPVDSTFRIGAGNLTLTIPAVQTNIENNIPYVSDLINIAPRTAAAAYNEAGLNRTYPVYMRPMASQLTLKADYAGTDATLAALYTGDDPIEEIKVTSMDLLTAAGTEFTTEIPLQFGAANAAWNAPAPTAVPNNAWAQETQFNIGGIVPAGQTTKLTAKDDCLLEGNQGCKFLILPQGVIPAAGVAQGGVCVNTIYGKVVIANGAQGSLYNATEIADAWYRYVTNPAAPTANIDLAENAPTAPEASGEGAGKFKYTSEPAIGMKQTINNYSIATVSSTTSPVQGEQVGAANTRFVKVLLNHLDMSDLHVKSDKQLRDAARVWQKMGLNTVTVYLDGKSATDGDFDISQNTIQTIHAINAAEAAAGTGKSFTVKPCTVAGEACTTIVITGGGDIPDLRFIKNNAGTPAVVALNAGETWNFKDNVIIVDPIDVSFIANRGILENAATATLKMFDSTPVAAATQVLTVPFANQGAWNITGGDLNVQFDVTNVGTVEIASGAEYHQDGAAGVTTFTNDAYTLEQRFLAAGQNEWIGKVNNHGVFATVKNGIIDNFGLIEHLEKSAKTYVTHNQTYMPAYATNANFTLDFDATVGTENKLGRINLPFSNKDEENVSISNGAATGFVSVTVKPGEGAAKDLDLSKVGEYVNYCIIKGGVETIKTVSTKIKYVEFDAGTDEIMWNVATANYNGIVVFSPVNIKRGTTVNINAGGSVYLKAKMYVGGTTNIASGTCSGYFGNTSANFDTMYITY